MASRAIIGLTDGTKHKLSYVASGGNPVFYAEQLSIEIKALLKTDLEQLFNTIKLVEEEGIPTKKQVKDLQDRGIDAGGVTFGERLVDHQQTFKGLVESMYIVDAYDLATSSLWCEWGYVLHLGEQKLQFYRGYNNDKPGNGIFKGETGYAGHQAPRLLKELTFDEVDKMEDYQLEEYIIKLEDL